MRKMRDRSCEREEKNTPLRCIVSFTPKQILKEKSQLKLFVEKYTLIICLVYHVGNYFGIYRIVLQLIQVNFELLRAYFCLCFCHIFNSTIPQLCKYKFLNKKVVAVQLSSCLLLLCSTLWVSDILQQFVYDTGANPS